MKSFRRLYKVVTPLSYRPPAAITKYTWAYSEKQAILQVERRSPSLTTSETYCLPAWLEEKENAN